MLPVHKDEYFKNERNMDYLMLGGGVAALILGAAIYTPNMSYAKQIE